MKTELTNPFTSIHQSIDELRELLVKTNKRLEASPEKSNPHERLTRKEVREEYKVSFGTIHNGMKSGKLSYDKLGRKTLFKRVEVENWINKKGSNNE